ncbi:MAG: hypothetical protein LBM98_06715 [Oscillospiraceae bacterium]|nr:hypothetical protein [Oscillospiraceae bacterium]
MRLRVKSPSTRRARLCEAPVSPRYAECYRCEAIQCRGDNIRLTYLKLLRQPWIASPHYTCTYRECGGGFAMTVESASLLRGLGRGCEVTAQKKKKLLFLIKQSATLIEKIIIYTPFYRREGASYGKFRPPYIRPYSRFEGKTETD